MAAGNSVSAPERTLVTTRIYDAPREAVYKAWIDPKQLVGTVEVHETDVGGNRVPLTPPGPYARESPLPARERDSRILGPVRDNTD